MYRALGIGNGTLRMLAGFQNRINGRLQVAHIVHRVKHPEHIHAIGRRAFDKLVHQIIGIMPITQQILPPQQHLLWRPRHGFFQFTDTFPRVFAQIADTGIERGATPGLQ